MNSKQFKVWRKKMSWSQAQAAEGLMVTKVTISNYERAKTPIHPHVQALMLSLGAFLHLEYLSALQKFLSERVKAANAVGQVHRDWLAGVPNKDRKKA